MTEQFEKRLNAVGAKASDVEERFVRGSGAGGQKINKTSSSVWLRHRPTGIEVRCQQERSQSANRAIAWETLCQKLELRAGAEKSAAIAAREVERRRTRQKSRGQKVRMIQTKKHRAKIKGSRTRTSTDDQ